MKLTDWFLLGTAAVSAVAAAVWLSDRKGAGMSDDAIRKRVVDIAKSQIGKPLSPEYLAQAAPAFVGQKPEWCGIFALWVLKQAGLGAGITWVVAKGFLFHLKRTSSPQPGDIAYYTKFQHQAVVAGVRGDEVDLINGNGAGGVVSVSTKRLDEAAAYYSIQPWLDAVKGGAA